MSDFRHIDIFHGEKVRNWFQTVLECEETLCRHVSELSGKESFVVGYVFVQLVSELETLVDLNFRLDTCGDDWDGKHVGKVLGQGRRVDSFDSATSQFGKSAERVDVALVSLD